MDDNLLFLAAMRMPHCARNLTQPRRAAWRLVKPLGEGLLVAASLLVLCAPVRAQTPVAGLYRCAAVQIDGHRGPCLVPPLILRPDGRYKIWGEEGTYRVRGRWLVLSESRKRGLGRFEHGPDIVFVYTYRGRRHEIRFRRQNHPPSGSMSV